MSNTAAFYTLALRRAIVDCALQAPADRQFRAYPEGSGAPGGCERGPKWTSG
jgi:hypothetical protein